MSLLGYECSDFCNVAEIHDILLDINLKQVSSRKDPFTEKSFG